MATDYLRDTIIPDSIGIQAQYLEARGHFTKRRSWKPEEVSGSGGGSHLPFSGRTLAPAVPASQNLSRRASPPVHPPASLYYPEQGLFASPAGNNAPHVDPARFITPSYQRFSDDSPMGMDRDERVADQIQVPAREGSVPLVYMDQQPIPQPGDAIRCPYGWCSSTFTRIGDLERHLTTASIHNPTKAGTADSSKRCRKCGEQFSRSDARNRHELKNSCWKRKHTSRRTSQHDAV
ncbi:hypothetical protein FPV67DRAFT_1042448 [Lyophyllum atratum]|nr:hypothetical protein FPV67DRAFT_1042448 [Lyophyllum atratum]